MTAKATAFAPAKINLTLHVTGQRPDGYHLLDSLVVFADIGDEISAETSAELSLSVTGPMARGVPEDGRNLMIKAARLFDTDMGAALSLVKNLPPASGIGGGSSDAAATLRVLSVLWGCDLPLKERVLTLGADLPVCLSPAPQRMSGIGDVLAPVSGVPDCPILLVNPRVEVPTPAVFKAMRRRDNPPMPENFPSWADAQEFAEWIKTQRNDMQAAAIQNAPVIADVLTALNTLPGVMVSRMSGSGATCFALFDSPEARDAATGRLAVAHPAWWVAAGQIKSDPIGPL